VIKKAAKRSFKTLLINHPKKIIASASILLLLFTYLTFRNVSKYSETLNINIKASALKGGEYGNFLSAFISALNEDSSKYAVNIEKVESPDASISTIDQLDQGYADIGLSQSNAKRNSKNVAAIAYVYVEPYLCISNRNDIHTISDILKCKDTLKIARLAPNSQTSRDLKVLLKFYGIDSSKIKLIDAVYDTAGLMLHQKKADLGFFIIGLGNKAITGMMKDSTLHLVNFENIDACLTLNHKLTRFILPKGIYGLNHPTHNYETFATKAMLITRKDLGDHKVYKIAKALFEKESEIVDRYPFFQLEKIIDPERNYIPIHSGALKYYKKDEPSFLDKNSNLIATVLSILGLVLSAVPLIIEFRVKQKVNQNLKPQMVTTANIDVGINKKDETSKKAISEHQNRQ
jgi:TRAP transporter TAXI family solute receptor